MKELCVSMLCFRKSVFVCEKLLFQHNFQGENGFVSHRVLAHTHSLTCSLACAIRTPFFFYLHIAEVLQQLAKQLKDDLPAGAAASFINFAGEVASGGGADSLEEMRTLGLEKDIMAVE